MTNKDKEIQLHEIARNLSHKDYLKLIEYLKQTKENTLNEFAEKIKKSLKYKIMFSNKQVEEHINKILKEMK